MKITSADSDGKGSSSFEAEEKVWHQGEKLDFLFIWRVDRVHCLYFADGQQPVKGGKLKNCL
jgi:hypothetical protein